MMEALFTIDFISEEEAEIIASSISREKIPRCEIKISHEGKVVSLRISAENSVALRAACNSYLKWIDMAHKIERFARKNGCR